MCGREERVRRKRGYKQVADKELPRTNTKRRGLNPTLDVVLRGSACDTTDWMQRTEWVVVKWRGRTSCHQLLPQLISNACNWLFKCWEVVHLLMFPFFKFDQELMLEWKGQFPTQQKMTSNVCVNIVMTTSDSANSLARLTLHTAH